MRDKEFIKSETDEILKELWEIKDQYSLSCKSDFSVLVQKVKEEIKGISLTSVKDTGNKKAIL